MSKEEAYMLWRTGEIPAPPKKYETYCKLMLKTHKANLRLARTEESENG